MNKITEIYQALIKVFVRSNKRFPAGKELQDLERQAREVFDGALTYNIDQAKGKNLDDITVMEKTTEKNADQLIDDYLSNEEIKGRMTSEPPTFTQVDQRKLPRAEIEALPLKDKEKAEAAVKKKLEAQNEQTRQKTGGGESGGGQRGRPELVKPGFGDTIYLDKSDMTKLMDEAYRSFDAADDALRAGDYDGARGILRYEIEENYKYPKAVRDAAYDARIFVRRGEGIDYKGMGYENQDEAMTAMKEKITEGQNYTSEQNWPAFTENYDDATEMKNIEYVNFLDEPGEDFGTPNSVITSLDDFGYNFADGGRVGFSNGGIKGKLIELINKISKSRKVKKPEAENFAQLLDDIEQAKKAGIIDEAGFKSFQRGIESMRDAAYGSRMKYPSGVPGGKSALPVDDKDLVPKTNLKKVRSQKKADDEGIKSLAESKQIPVRDDTVKSKYRFSGRETLDDLRDLEDKGIVSRADINVYGDRYLDYLDAKVKYKFGYTKGQMDKIKNQPARLNHLRAKADPNWGEANFGSDYLRILEKERGIEASGGTPTFSRLKGEPIFPKPTIKAVKELDLDDIKRAHLDNIEGSNYVGNDDKYDAHVLAEMIGNNQFGIEDFYDLPEDVQMDLYWKSWEYLRDLRADFADMQRSAMKGPIDMKTGKNIITGQKVMDVDYIPGEEPLTPKPKKTPRKDNAEGGLNYLLGF